MLNTLKRYWNKLPEFWKFYVKMLSGVSALTAAFYFAAVLGKLAVVILAFLLVSYVVAKFIYFLHNA